jgi:hydroxymethylglutaryl-CoA synthase
MSVCVPTDLPWQHVWQVGTETLVDKSKAVKTTLMQLFESHGNHDIEGIDSKNACYGGTAALLNSLAWVESSAWDGRYAVVVAGDIAVYEPGPARPTGGAGVLAMLIGPDAPMVIEPGLRASHMEDVYDFYKPTMASEYPRVDGHLSNACYLRALDGCYTRYAERYEKRMGAPFTLDAADYAVFHAPYNKLVQKSFGRYLYNDYKTGKSDTDLGFAQFDGLTPDETYTDRTFLKHLVTVSKDHYQRMVQPSELITSRFGLARLSLCCASGVK